MKASLTSPFFLPNAKPPVVIRRKIFCLTSNLDCTRRPRCSGNRHQFSHVLMQEQEPRRRYCKYPSSNVATQQASVSKLNCPAILRDRPTHHPQPDVGHCPCRDMTCLAVSARVRVRPSLLCLLPPPFDSSSLNRYFAGMNACHCPISGTLMATDSRRHARSHFRPDSDRESSR